MTIILIFENNVIYIILYLSTQPTMYKYKNDFFFNNLISINLERETNPNSHFVYGVRLGKTCAFEKKN